MPCPAPRTQPAESFAGPPERFGSRAGSPLGASLANGLSGSGRRCDAETRWPSLNDGQASTHTSTQTTRRHRHVIAAAEPAPLRQAARSGPPSQKAPPGCRAAAPPIHSSRFPLAGPIPRTSRPHGVASCPTLTGCVCLFFPFILPPCPPTHSISLSGSLSLVCVFFSYLTTHPSFAPLLLFLSPTLPPYE